MQARKDDDRNVYLSIVVELGPGVVPDQDKTAAVADSTIRRHLPVGIKHRYTRW